MASIPVLMGLLKELVETDFTSADCPFCFNYITFKGEGHYSDCLVIRTKESLLDLYAEGYA